MIFILTVHWLFSYEKFCCVWVIENILPEKKQTVFSSFLSTFIGEKLRTGYINFPTVVYWVRNWGNELVQGWGPYYQAWQCGV